MSMTHLSTFSPHFAVSIGLQTNHLNSRLSKISIVSSFSLQLCISFAMDSRGTPPPPFHHLQPLQPGVLMGSYTEHQFHNSFPPAMPTSMTLQPQNPRFPFNSMTAGAAAASAPNPDHHYSEGSPTSGGGCAGFSIEQVRKKRGRPRKYSPDNSIGLGLSPVPGNHVSSTARQEDSSGGGGSGTQPSETPAKRSRGRPPGSVKKQLNALGVPGVGFTPHVLMANAGEDIASKIMEFCQQGPRIVCILTANGSISNVTLRQPTISGGTVSYEGKFEIISLSGSFMLSESTGNSNFVGSLSVLLAGSDGRVFGGGISGTLKAASSVQIIVGSFIVGGKKSKSALASTPSNTLNFNISAAGVSPPSHGDASESAEENDESPLNHGSGSYGKTSQPIQSIPMYSSMGWPNSIKMHPG